jgi:hypothetical protein
VGGGEWATRIEPVGEGVFRGDGQETLSHTVSATVNSTASGSLASR